jgi:hypothetical protein
MKNSMKILCLILFIAIFSFATLSKETRTNFVSSCIDGGSSSVFCECVFKKMEQKYTQSQIDAIELKMQSGQSDLGYSNFIKSTSKECNAKTKSGTSLGAMAANENKSNQKTQSTLSSGDFEAMENMDIQAAFAQGMMAAMIESPQFKNMFIAQCDTELIPYFGNKQATSTCECSYEKILSSGYIQKILNSINEEGKLEDSLTVELFMPCIPKTYTPQMEQFLMSSCQTKATKNICNCIVKDIKKSFTLEQLLRKTLTDPTFIESYATGAAMRCKNN